MLNSIALQVEPHCSGQWMEWKLTGVQSKRETYPTLQRLIPRTVRLVTDLNSLCTVRSLTVTPLSSVPRCTTAWYMKAT